MYRITFGSFIFVLYLNCIYSAPSSLLSALMPSPSSSTQEEAEATGLTTYDQKQSGKYNIHVNIKDVAIIALDAGNMDGGLGDFGDDYYEDYDSSDFTVRPIFGLIDIPSQKPNSTSQAAPSLVHFEPFDGFNETSNTTQNIVVSNSSIEEPIIKNPSTIVKEPTQFNSLPNKTQSVFILTESTTPVPQSNLSNLIHSEVMSNGIIVTTPTLSPDQLPPRPSLSNFSLPLKPSLNSLLNSNVAESSFQPNEIPVQIILEPIQSSNVQQRINNLRIRNRVRIPATPSNNRRITPPQFEYDSLQRFPSSGNNKFHKNAMKNGNRRNCVLDQNGLCQNGNRRFGSPTL